MKHIDEIIPEYQNLMKHGELSGIPTGFEKIDKIISGFHKSELIIIGARPAMGKTAFVLSLLKNIAVDLNIATAVFSLEVSTSSFFNKLIANISEVENQSIRIGDLKKEEEEKIAATIKNLEKVSLDIDDTPRLSIKNLCDKARKLVFKNGVKIIFIDYIQLLTVSEKFTDSRYNELNFISRELKSLAKELNIPIIVTSQLNRNVEDRQGYDGKKPILADLRDSGTLCDDADIVCFIHRPEYYKITEDNQGNSLIGIGEFLVAKNRNGAVGDAQMRFKSAYARFDNLEEIQFSDFDFTEYQSEINQRNKENPF